MKDKAKIWSLIVLSYIATFGTPITFGYIFFAEQIEAKTGGGLFYIVSTIVGTFLVIKMLLAIRKWKASIAKAIIKATITLGLLYIVYEVIGYVTFNFEDLATLVLYTIIGRTVAVVLEILAIRIDKVYVEEIGVI
jgi:hypothetical protein